MENILTISALTKVYGTVTAVNQLELNIPKGSVFGLLGPNGSGKTTTLGMILGVTHPSSGSFKWFGQNLSFDIKQKIGALLETPNFYPYLSATENLKIVATIKELKDYNIDEVLKTVNLHQRANSKFSTYSLGMKQRLAIASALLSNPQVLVLDEPTNGLDPEGIAEIRNIVTQIAASGISVILSSHLLDEIEKVCTHVAVLQQGKLLFSGTVDQLTGHEGAVEVNAADTDALQNALHNIHGIEKINKNDDGSFNLILNNQIKASEINKALVEQGIYVNHLIFKKNSLEKQFLNLIKNPS